MEKSTEYIHLLYIFNITDIASIIMTPVSGSVDRLELQVVCAGGFMQLSTSQVPQELLFIQKQTSKG